MGGGAGGSGFYAFLMVGAVIAAGIKLIMSARYNSTWDPKVAKMSLYSGIATTVFGVGLLWAVIRWSILMHG